MRLISYNVNFLFCLNFQLQRTFSKHKFYLFFIYEMATITHNVLICIDKLFNDIDQINKKKNLKSFISDLGHFGAFLEANISFSNEKNDWLIKQIWV